jgi:hypothetical protein
MLPREMLTTFVFNFSGENKERLEADKNNLVHPRCVSFSLHLPRYPVLQRQQFCN